MQGLSVLIPLYNEADTVYRVVENLYGLLRKRKNPFEIIVINDGSTDGSADWVPQWAHIKLMHHPKNLGYGAALKTGFLHSQFDTLAFFDADGQHDPVDLVRLSKAHGKGVLTVGIRSDNAPGRRLCRKALNTWAGFLSGTPLKDPCSGIRVMEKAFMHQFLPLLPDRYSLSTTLTLCAARNHLGFTEVPVHARPRPEGRGFLPSWHTFWIPLRLLWQFGIRQADRRLVKSLNQEAKKAASENAA